MLIFYKPYDFRFSDIEFTESDQDFGYYNNKDINIIVTRSSISPSLYNLHFRSISRHITMDSLYGKTKAEVEVIVHGLIKKEKHASIV